MAIEQGGGQDRPPRQPNGDTSAALPALPDTGRTRDAFDQRPSISGEPPADTRAIAAGDSKRGGRRVSAPIKDTDASDVQRRLTPTPASEIKFYSEVQYDEPDEQTLPEVTEVGDVFVITTSHFTPVGDTPVPDFHRAITEAQTIIMESTPDIVSGTYEDLAVKATGEKGVSFLEKDIDVIDVLSKAGIQPQMAAFYEVMPSLVRSLENPDWSPAKLIESLKSDTSYFASRSDAQIAKRLEQWRHNIDKHIKTYGSIDGWDIIHAYLMGLRDADMFSPEMIAGIKAIQGKKAIIVGLGHGDTVIQALDGNYPEKPPKWRDFMHEMTSLDPRIGTAIQIFSELAYSEKK